MSEAKPCSTSSDILKECLTFGKHKGKTWEEVLKADNQYIIWVLENFDLSKLKDGEELRQALSKRVEIKIKNPKKARTASAPAASPRQRTREEILLGRMTERDVYTNGRGETVHVVPE